MKESVFFAANSQVVYIVFIVQSLCLFIQTAVCHGQEGVVPLWRSLNSVSGGIGHVELWLKVFCMAKVLVAVICLQSENYIFFVR